MTSPLAHPLGLQLWSLRRECETDAEGTLRQVRALGFDGIETAGTYGWPLEKWRALLAETGLQVIGAHLGDLFENLSEQMAFQGALGNRRYVVPWLDEKERSPEGYRKLAERLNRAGATLRSHGAELYYHNHDFEFADLGTGDGLTGYDILLKETDPAAVRFEVDTFWVARVGKDPLAFLRQNADRIGLVHAKQIRLAEKVEVRADLGDIDFVPIVALAREKGWPVVFEYEGEGAIEICRAGAAHLRRCAAAGV
ncbi:Sugar phosphate isomerase/epimerase [Verrucomicrobium sp. GAS474]|uniref:sugar phosphate isomerase/epimerase family protein n=1 Tax=Verrucomicrobium sp. GAS474 TaxID=1882831 RepID=UPI00087A9ED3|nr:sugar phosphate isomerase/epimerase [Verrucomicrobium sp. GAS474]SDT90155.1 Sugar phosphate isomerase/epimerase [Verrucomicrobium sp. GAS474]